MGRDGRKCHLAGRGPRGDGRRWPARHVGRARPGSGRRRTTGTDVPAQSQHRDTFAGLWRSARSGSITVAMTHDPEAVARELERAFPDVGPLIGVQRRFPEERLLAVRGEVRRLLQDVAFEWNHLALDVVNNRVELGVPESSTSASTLERRFAPELVVVAQDAVWTPLRPQVPSAE